MTSQVTTTETKSQPPSLLAKMAGRFSVEPAKMLGTLKATAFKGEVSNEQMMALLIVADQYGLNPWTKEIYAFPDKQNGIVPVVGVDGWARIINTHDQFDGMDFEQSESMETMPDGKPCPEWIECIIFRKDRSHPIRVREYLDEVYRSPFKGNGRNGEYTVNGPWQSHTKRMLRHKAMIQAARMAFGFVGIYDQDEAERIVEKDITPESTATTPAPASRTQALKDSLKSKPVTIDQETGEINDKATQEPPVDPDDDFLKGLESASQA